MITSSPYFKKLEEPINCGDYSIIGVFPYETAAVYTDGCNPPRVCAANVENNLPRNFRDNKIVVICQDNVNFGTSNFAVFLKDLKCTFGSWDDVIGYGGKSLFPKST